MFTPDTPYDDKVNALPEWAEPFPVPQTIPCGWDLSEVLSAPTSDLVDETELSAKG
jgi:hypothetical protein